jgi:DNA-directed RNA polymerase specialized sigma24 family protein
VVAVRMRELGAALARLDPASRALLDLSLRQGLPDEEVARRLGGRAEEVDRRRGEVLERLAEELHLDGREARDELFATLPDLPAQYCPKARRAL